MRSLADTLKSNGYQYSNSFGGNKTKVRDEKANQGNDGRCSVERMVGKRVRGKERGSKGRETGVKKGAESEKGEKDECQAG